MRYYTIIITNPIDGKEVIRWTSLGLNGVNNLSAQQIEFDILTYTLADEIGSSFIKVSGVSIKQIGGAFNLNNMQFKMYAGMSKGLPLSNPKQSGLIIVGIIQQCFGNWQGTNQDLNFIVQSAQGSASDPRNIILNWKRGSRLSDALSATLKTAFPDYSINVNISGSLVISSDEPAFFQTAPQLARYALNASKNINKDPNYGGVQMTIREKSIEVYDGSTQSTPKEISFNDLIGQPVWQSLTQINFRTILRADIRVGDYVLMPKTLAQQTPQSFSQFRNSSVFQGKFFIDSVRHIGSFRGTSGADWITVFDAHLAEG